jgi:glucose-1-phosphate adenylyltransferase
MEEVVYCILAGGNGERLKPLTNDYPKPLLPFGGSGRIIDFTIYNTLLAGRGECVVLTQYLADRFDTCLDGNWKTAFHAQGRRLCVMPSYQSPKGTYEGTADAVYQAIIGQRYLPDYVIVVAGDHVYRMDYRPMLEFHAAHGAAATVAAIECNATEAHRFGVIDPRTDGSIENFYEKPRTLDGVVSPGQQSLVSMGIYVFSTKSLLAYLTKNQSQSSHDFGKDILPAMAEHGDAWIYPFRKNGDRPGYWRDIGELHAYLKGSMDLLHLKHLRFGPLPGGASSPFSTSKIVKECVLDSTRIINSIITSPAFIGGALVEDCIVGPRVEIHDGAVIRRSVILEGAVVRKHAHFEDAVIGPGIELFPHNSKRSQAETRSENTVRCECRHSNLDTQRQRAVHRS